MHTSTLVLVLSNLLTIVVALIMAWDLRQLVWIYWAQSVIIGTYQGLRMMALKKFSTEGFTSNDQPVPETPEGKRSTVIFFAVHYGFFHIGYLFFLLGLAHLDLNIIGWIGLAGCIAGFLVNHHFSFVANRQRDLRRVPNLGSMMFFPYLRVVPMHLTIILGFGMMQSSGRQTGALLLFLVLKSLSDVGMHVIEHREKIST